MIKELSVVLFILFACINLGQAQTSGAEGKAAAEESMKTEMRIAGDPGKGMFWVHFYLPKDAKKTIWTVTDEKGQVLIKEKYKNLKAGENKIRYNYKNAPDGVHTFKIVADKEYTLTKEVVKKK